MCIRDRKKEILIEDVIGAVAITKGRYSHDAWGSATKNTNDQEYLDKDACRQLLLKFDEAELRRRLLQSPYRHYQMSASQSWLREAAEAFDVSLKCLRAKGKQPYKKKEVLIEDVIGAVVTRKDRYSQDTWGTTKNTSCLLYTSPSPRDS